MAVTNFTPLLGLALPTTGDLQGTWGATVNTAITDLLDDAVAGTVTLTTDADVTLTTTNGADNQARNAIILCTGARTAIRTITAPAQSKIYVVINATTGGFGVKIVGAGPTTGITVLAGTRAILAWNGTDFVVSTGDLVGPSSATDNAITRFDSTTGKLVQNSLVTVADDGAIVAPQVGSIIPFYYANQAAFPSAATYHGALAHSHADGAMYFAHSSVWVRILDNGGPLGTPSSGTATNLTGLPLTTGVTGILPVANGGTATATPGLVQGSNITITGTWPNQTIAAAAPGSGTVTSVAATVPSLLSVSGSPITSSGTLAFNYSGTALPVANGGTSLTTLTANNVILGNGTSAPLFVAPSTSGNVLTSNGTTWASTAPATGGTVTSASVVSANGFAGTVATATTTPAITLTTSITGVLKGNGTAISAATAGTDYVTPAGTETLTNKTIAFGSNTLSDVASLSTAQTFTSTKTFAGSSSVLAEILTNAAEIATVSATAATGTINYDVTTQSVLYYTSNASANWTVNFRASSGTSLNTAMTTGQSVTAAFLVTQGATAYYNNVVQVDGSTVTPKYQGGTAYAAGNASSVDVYMYTIIKTGNAAFTVFTSQTKFA